MIPTKEIKKRSRGFYFPFEKRFSRDLSYHVPIELIREEQAEAELDYILNELKAYYEKSLHESIYQLEIPNREQKLRAIVNGILKTQKEIPNIKRAIPKIRVVIAPDEDYNANFFYVVAYLNREKIEDAVKAFEKLEDSILSNYPDKDIHILYSF